MKNTKKRWGKKKEKEGGNSEHRNSSGVPALTENGVLDSPVFVVLVGVHLTHGLQHLHGLQQLRDKAVGGCGLASALSGG